LLLLLLFDKVFSTDFIDNELILFCETSRMQKIKCGRPRLKQGGIASQKAGGTDIFLS